MRFINKQEASGLLSNLGLKTIKTPIKTPILGDILFKRYKTNEIVNKFSLTEALEFRTYCVVDVYSTYVWVVLLNKVLQLVTFLKKA